MVNQLGWLLALASNRYLSKVAKINLLLDYLDKLKYLKSRLRWVSVEILEQYYLIEVNFNKPIFV